MEMQAAANRLLSFIKQGTSPFHVVQAAKKELLDAGFVSLPWEEDWKLEQGGRYCVTVHGTTLFAFSIGDDANEASVFRIASAHTDHPCLHIKPAAEYAEKGYLRVNTDCYGGLIKSSWMDRPLSIAGKAALKSDSIFHPKIRLIDFERPLLTIPNLAIHMNRDTNKGVELNSQLHMLPLLGRKNTKGASPDNAAFFMELLADALDCSPEDILDFDLYIYNQEEGCLLGIGGELLSAPRLDNLTSAAACLSGLQSGGCKNTISLIFLFDNEEIGSRTKQGADSMIASLLLEKIHASLFGKRDYLTRALLKSHMISLDAAHGYHPNYPGVCDPTCVPELSLGPCIKMSSTQKYATDAEAVAIIMQLCSSWNIPFQKYVNRSDIAGGSTLGSLSSSWLPMLTADIGVPILAMHSARELMAAKDQEALEQLCRAFFTQD